MRKLQAAQLAGMIRYEFRMHWRRRGLIILMWGILVVIGISLLIAGDNFQQLSTSPNDPVLIRKVVTAALILTAFPPIGMGVAFFLPLVAAETIPLDRQYGVRELLDTLPISSNMYLTGKLLGLWTAVLSAMGLVMIVIGAFWWVKAGPINVGDYVVVWIGGIGSIVVLNGGLGVLMPASQPSRRRAIIVTLIGLAILAWLFGGATDSTDLRFLASPVRWTILNYYMFNSTEPLYAVSPTVNAPTPQIVLEAILVGLVEIAALFGTVNLWTNWRESRQ
jgi:ABC-type transport system involved in multi-copper enzyme maturation permease subunit